MTAEFGINATEVSPTQNTVSPKQGIKDSSLATLVSGLGGAAIQGTETLVTREATKFGQMYEEVTRMGLGGEAVTPEEKAFKEQMDAFQQVTQMGRPDVAKVYREAFLRKSIADKPWMAKRYEAMSGRIDSRWTDMISSMEQSEAAARNAAQAQQASAEKLMKEQRTRLAATAEKLGYFPNKPWTSMSQQDLDYHEMRIHMGNHNKTLIESYRADTAFENAQSAEGRAAAKERRAGINFADQRLALRAGEIADGQVNTASMELTKAMQDWVIQNPNATKEELARAGVDLSTAAVSAFRSSLINLNATNNLRLSPTDIEQRVDQLATNIKTYQELVTGPTAPSSVLARRVAQVEGENKISASVFLGPLATLKAAGVDLDLTSVQPFIAALSTERGVQAQLDLSKNFANLLSQYNSGGSYTPSSEPANQYFQLASGNLLVQAYKQGSESYKAMAQNPRAWSLFIAPAAGLISMAPYNEKFLILDAATNPILLNEIDKMPANIKDSSYQALETALRSMSSSMTAANKVTEVSPTGELQMPVSDAASQRELQELNMVFQRARIVEEKFRGETDPYAVIRKYFGGQLADKLQPAEEETPQ